MISNELIIQLSELAKACHRKEIKPIICGGLGVYLGFLKKQGEIKNMIRATQDIDLMLSEEDLVEEVKRRAIAKIITEDLEYIVCKDKQHHGFIKGQNQQLDILAPPIEGLDRKGYRIIIVKSTLHGHLTEEAQFIDEGLRPVPLSDIQADSKESEEIKVYVPSLTNLMIMKLYAFEDRIEGARQTLDRAMEHAWDIFITIMLTTDRIDYLEGQKFLSLHSDSEIIKRAQSIVADKFSAVHQAGWQRVLEASDFYPNLSRQEKENKLDIAGRRLARWFNVPY